MIGANWAYGIKHIPYGNQQGLGVIVPNLRVVYTQNYLHIPYATQSEIAINHLECYLCLLFLFVQSMLRQLKVNWTDGPSLLPINVGAAQPLTRSKKI